MNVDIYTLWAALKLEDPSPWMVAAEDEFSWEGNPDRCERVFQQARELCDEKDLDYREVTIEVDIDDIVRCFESGRVSGSVKQ